MSIGPGQPTEREPLTPEERELAQRLSRLGPSAGPASTIDARILAAAHEAVAARPRSGNRRTRRWPVALGAVASLALAVGIAWRLRPLPEPPQMQHEAAAARTIAHPTPAAAEAPAVQSETDDPAPIDREQRPAEQAVDTVHDAVKAESRRVPAAPPPAEPPIIVDEARASDVSPGAAPQPPPPAPPAPIADTTQNTGAPALDAVAPSPQERERMAEAADAAGAAQRAKSTTAPRAASAAAPALRREPQPFQDIEIVGTDDSGDEPPAYADSPQVREAWLRRVRELIAEGNLQQAHDSLHEFQRRYPEQALPDDLKRFQQSKSAPATP